MSLLTKIKNALHPRRLDEDLADEFRDHLERRAADLERRGLTRLEAERQSTLAFGNAMSLREQSREARLWVTLEACLRDVRYALRGLLRKPVFTATAVLSLSLAIGANTAVFSILDALLLRKLPVPEPDRLVTLATSEPDDILSAPAEGVTFSYPLYQQLRDAGEPAARLALLGSPNRVEAQIATSGTLREEVVEQVVSPDAFDILGVPPALGRLFSPAEDRLPSPRSVVVLSHAYWQRRFGADPCVLGRNFIVSGRTYSILGVAGRSFSGDEPGRSIDVWLPVTLSDPGIFVNPEFRMFHLVGRLAPYAAPRDLAARLQPAFHHHQEDRLASQAALPPVLQKRLRNATILVTPGAGGASSLRLTFARPLWTLAGVSLCVLLIACANLAGLMLARGAARAGEMALRTSLGASRIRLLQQLLTESFLISLLAAMGGFFLARVAAPAFVSLVSSQAQPIRLDLPIDVGILLLCVTVCSVVALFFGAVPAWQAATPQPIQGLRNAAGSSGRLRIGRFFVGVQVAFAFGLTVTGAGFLFSLRNLTAVDTGFDPRGVTVLTVAGDSESHDLQFSLMRQLQARAAQLSNIRSAAAAWLPIFSGSRRAQRVTLPGHAPSGSEETFYRVGPGYFATLHTPLLCGRDLNFADNDNEPVAAVVNRAFARKYFGVDFPLGRQFQRDDGARHVIVGISADSLYGGLRNGPEPIVYMPMKPPRAFTLYVRSSLDPASVAKMVGREAAELGSGLRVRDAVPLVALVDGTIVKEKLLAAVSGAFAFLGLVLAGVGLFGILNYSVARRTREIGIRTALGARRLPICGLVLGDLIGIVATGLFAGTLASVSLLRLARSMLFQIQPADPLVIGSALTVFLGVALIAGGLPAWRAASVDPLLALRQE